jgi:hypothetical protein
MAAGIASIAEEEGVRIIGAGAGHAREVVRNRIQLWLGLKAPASSNECPVKLLLQ